MDVEETIRQYQREAMEADFRARSAAARAEAIQHVLNAAMRLYVDQLAAPWIALAAEIRAQRRNDG